MIFFGCFLFVGRCHPELFLFPPNPAAASGAGIWGAQPLSNRFFPPTQNVEEPFFFSTHADLPFAELDDTMVEIEDTAWPPVQLCWLD
jgi:hypothetical protein